MFENNYVLDTLMKAHDAMLLRYTRENVETVKRFTDTYMRDYRLGGVKKRRAE